MKPVGRERGRYVSLSGLAVIRCATGASFPRIVIDAQGLPLYPYTKWYALRMHDQAPARTITTYLHFLLPFAGYLHARHIPWNSPPEIIRHHFKVFLRTELHLQEDDDHVLEGTRFALSGSTPLKASSLRVMLAAWSDFYDTMADDDVRLYVYGNPMVSALRRKLERERRKHIVASGAPEHAGIRSESRIGGGSPAFFRIRRAPGWQLREEYTSADMVRDLSSAFETLVATPRLSLRDKIVLLLLRWTGARVHEICQMTVGGYRSHTNEGISGRALVIDKGGGGIESKPIYFEGRADIPGLVERYVRRERSRIDPHHRTKLEQLDDEEPLFLTARGTPLAYATFRSVWRRIYPRASHLVPNGFSMHDLRHLLVTELLLKAKIAASTDPNSDYAVGKRRVKDLIGWRSITTIEVYDHSITMIDSIALLSSLQREGFDALQTESVSAGKSEPGATPIPVCAIQPRFALSQDEVADWIDRA